VRIAAPSEAESPGSALPPVSTGPDPVRRSLPRTVESLQVRNFRVFLCGLLLAGTGVRAQRMAQDWLVLTMTGSPAAVGITTACQFLPILFLGLHGGVLADRFPRRRLLQVTQACMTGVSVVTASLVLTGRVEVWHIYLLALALGVATAVDDPGRDSFITELVGVAHLRNAISLVSSTFQVGAMAGPVVGGVLMGTAGSAMRSWPTRWATRRWSSRWAWCRRASCTSDGRGRAAGPGSGRGSATPPPHRPCCGRR
jgi:MFS family permease